MDTAKDQYKLSKDQNVINNNREDDLKAKDGGKAEEGAKAKDDETTHVGHFHIGDEYKNLISKIFQYGLMDGDLHLTHCDNRQLG